MKRFMKLEPFYIRDEDLEKEEGYTKEEMEKHGMVNSKIYTLKDKITGLHPADQFGSKWTKDIEKADIFYGEYFAEEAIECALDDYYSYDTGDIMLYEMRDGAVLHKESWGSNFCFIFKRFDSVAGSIKNIKAKNILTIAGLHESIVDESDQDTDILIYRDGKIKNWKPLLDDLLNDKWSEVELIEIV